MTLRHDNVSTDVDTRILNVLNAIKDETGDLADLVRWCAVNWQRARAALKTLEANQALLDYHLAEVVRVGLEVQDED